MKNTTFCYLAGGLSLLGGILALANPFAASLTATVLAGWSFIAVGTLMLIAANHPLGFHLAVFLLGLLVAGILRISAALRLYGYFRGTLLVSGLLSFVLAVLIFADFPQSANVILGLFLAIELLSNGISLIALGMARSRY